MANNPILVLQSIERTYRQGDNLLNILRRAELKVWAGQLVALVAPSGAGKSTLLHVAGLLERQDAGFISGENGEQTIDLGHGVRGTKDGGGRTTLRSSIGSGTRPDERDALRGAGAARARRSRRTRAES